VTFPDRIVDTTPDAVSCKSQYAIPTGRVAESVADKTQVTCPFAPDVTVQVNAAFTVVESGEVLICAI
jgi:hypothetical protein